VTSAFMASLPFVFLLGLSLGGGACMLTCVPTLGSVMLAQPLSPRSAHAMTMRFNFGRLVGYMLLTGASGGIGVSIAAGMDVRHADWLLGAMLLLSAWLLWRSVPQQPCKRHQQGAMMGGLFGMGLGVSLKPCAPLSGVLATAAVSGSVLQGLVLGLVFGLGGALLPQLVFGHALGHAGSHVRAQMGRVTMYMRPAGVTILALLGVGVMNGWVEM